METSTSAFHPDSEHLNADVIAVQIRCDELLTLGGMEALAFPAAVRRLLVADVEHDRLAIHF